MSAPVPRQKGDAPPGQLAEHEIVRRRAERGLDERLFLSFEAGHGVEPAAADDSDFRFQIQLS